MVYGFMQQPAPRSALARIRTAWPRGVSGTGDRPSRIARRTRPRARRQVATKATRAPVDGRTGGALPRCIGIVLYTARQATGPSAHLSSQCLKKAGLEGISVGPGTPFTRYEQQRARDTWPKYDQNVTKVPNNLAQNSAPLSGGVTLVTS